MAEAARTCNLEAIAFLISYGADIDAVDEDSRTALHQALWGQAGLIESLERSGPNLEAVGDSGLTPLHIAASICGDVGAIKALLKLGAKQAVVDKRSQTPIHSAATS